jgi:phosphatidylinositol 4-kinase
MATNSSGVDDPLPTAAQVAEVQKFLVELDGLKSKLEHKKAEAQKVISSKMKDLHQLIDKWETRLLDTMAETLDEKIEGIAKQKEKMQSTVDWIQDQRKTKRMSRVFPSQMRASPQPAANEADTEEGLQKAMVEPDEEELEKPEEELAKKHWRVWKALKFPLQPAGVTAAEVSVDLWTEFGPILEESRKSLKRSMLFVGGIVRAYMRRGHKKDEWVAMVRRLEARVETTPGADLALDSGMVTSTSATGLLPSAGGTSRGNNSAMVSTIWMAISDAYKYRNVASVRAPLAKQFNYMYSNYPAHVEFYLPQLANLLLCHKDFPLTDFIMECCRNEPHFAIQAYFLISSMSQVGSAKWQKRCIKTLKQLIKAIPVAQAAGSSIPSKKLLSTPSTISEEPSDPATCEFPLGLPTDSHHLQLLFSPRSSSSTIPIIPSLQSHSHHSHASSHHSHHHHHHDNASSHFSDLLSSGGIDGTSVYSTSPDFIGGHSADSGTGETLAHKSETAPLPFPLLDTVSEEPEKGHMDTGSKETPSELSKSAPNRLSLEFGPPAKSGIVTPVPRAHEASPPPLITLSSSTTLKRVLSSSSSSKEGDEDSSNFGAQHSKSETVDDNHHEASSVAMPAIVMKPASPAIPIARPSVRYKSPPPHLYSVSPANSPLVGSGLMSKTDLTSELKAAVTAVSIAVKDDAKNAAVDSTLLSGLDILAAPHASLQTQSVAEDSSMDSNHLSVPSGHSALRSSDHSEPYNSDDPEQELARLTRITKPPTAPRVEKNLEVPEGKEYFFTQIKFMRKLIDVSRKLGELYGKPELYKPQLDRELEALSTYIDTGFAYMPTRSGVRTRVLRFALSDCHPIPTYGRVLYKMIIEVVNLPAHYTKEMADEYVKLNKDFRRLSLSQASSSSSSSDSKHGQHHQSQPYHEEHEPLGIEEELKVLESKPLSAIRGQIATSASLPALSASSEPPSAFGDAWKDVRRRLKAHSHFSALPHWDVRAYIVKHGDLVLQEQFVMQLLVQFQHIWELEGLPLKLCCYNIMATSYQSGLIEVVPNSISLDKLKKLTENSDGMSLSLYEFFKKTWPNNEDFKKARSNFVASLAAYSVVCYLLQIKDRHNGNIMLDSEGCIFHIDFGYLLARTIKFERAPFKLTDEFIEVLGGDQSKSYKAYCHLCVLGFLAARKHYEKILLLVEMSAGEGAAIPCLEGDSVAPNLKNRFHLDWTEAECESYILNTIGDARDNWRTQIYDTYQRIVNNIH